MMQMLRFRGGSVGLSPSQNSPRTPNPDHSPTSAAAATPSGPSSGSAAACVTPGSVGPPRPMRLVYYDEKGKFQMDAEAVATLQLVKGPVGVVAVCGRARQGKSFVLNQLLGRSSGFQVASTHRPCTKGLWMWSAPLKQTALDGSEYNLLLLDTEGIDAYDQTGTYSTQIFSLAVLLSSMFIYNQMGGIDEAALDRLSLVTEMTKHIRVRASGRRSTISELGQFSPVFVWLLRDFYLELAEDNQRITPRDYLELALRPVQGGGKDVFSKNEIRESIRALFPDRECFTLVRPLNDESELRCLDQIPLERLRPEFRSGLDTLTKFVFDRTRPKQIGATVMTGPVLVGLTQSFLDAINNGAVPIIYSSWQSVEEAECHRAYESATRIYMSSFNRRAPAEEAVLREVHEEAVRKSLAAYNAGAVGTGSARLNYEKLLHNFLKKEFEDYKRAAFLEADLLCSNTVQSMEKKLREACYNPDAKVDSVIKVLDSLFAEYELSAHGPSKWKILATFLRQCLEGPILDFLKKQLDQIESERSSLALKCRSDEDKLRLLNMQFEASERHRSEYLKRYEDAISDKQRLSDDLSARIVNLQGKCSTLEERCMSFSRDLELVRNESSGWRTNYEQNCLELKANEEKFKAQKATLESRYNAAEVRLAAAREQAASAQEEASEWKRKYDFASGEAKTAIERTGFVQERNNSKAQEREDALREEFDSQLADKVREIRNLTSKLDYVEVENNTLASELESAESKMVNHELEMSALKNEIKDLIEKLDSAKAIALSYEKESKMLEQEQNYLHEKYLSECKKFDEAEHRCKAAEIDAKRATELADAARAEVITTQKEKSELQRLALERLALIERAERQINFLEQEKSKLVDEVARLLQSETDARSKVTSLEKRVDEREKEYENLLSQSNEQRSNTVQVLESLLATERAARSEANSRAEALSLQLQATQSKLDALHQELTSIRLNETALDSKIRNVSRNVSHGKHPRTEDCLGTESVHDIDVDGVLRGRKRSKSTSSPLKYVPTEDGSVYKGEDIFSQSQEIQEIGSEDYTKFSIQQLKQEITKHGYGAELLMLKNPNKKEILALYRKHVLGE